MPVCFDIKMLQNWHHERNVFRQRCERGDAVGDVFDEFDVFVGDGAYGGVGM
jgi:hypothetical protein